ncbi:28S ribosomal protein S15, mitochondrial-like [Nannospalax galili]|uniref:28S ribosomal protein S15, mitochondrial-like n=1 Tax=Nannospalax galili TaxID=1026970 RepID=UPI000819A6FE|nr:28S ribosomal protein S15, mitochondrial-like [Nannospalax galili]
MASKTPTCCVCNHRSETVQPSEHREPPLPTLMKDYKNIIAGTDVVKSILLLEMANRKEKLNMKQETLMSKIAENSEDTRSLEAQIVALMIKFLQLRRTHAETLKGQSPKTPSADEYRPKEKDAQNLPPDQL